MIFFLCRRHYFATGKNRCHSLALNFSKVIIITGNFVQSFQYRLQQHGLHCGYRCRITPHTTFFIRIRIFISIFTVFIIRIIIEIVNIIIVIFVFGSFGIFLLLFFFLFQLVIYITFDVDIRIQIIIDFIKIFFV